MCAELSMIREFHQLKSLKLYLQKVLNADLYVQILLLSLITNISVIFFFFGGGCLTLFLKWLKAYSPSKETWIVLRKSHCSEIWVALHFWFLWRLIQIDFWGKKCNLNQIIFKQLKTEAKAPRVKNNKSSVFLLIH